MQLIERLEDIDFADGETPVHMAVGTFDGVHRGHQELLGRLAGKADNSGGLTAALTFKNHPRTIVSPQGAPPLLSPWPLKRRLLQRLPIDKLIALTFDRKLMAMPAETFVEDVLVGLCRAKVIHSGRNFHFGFHATGGPELLARKATVFGYTYETLEPIEIDGERVSSTRIREELAAGRVELAGKLLGRPHQVCSPVYSGEALGRQIGFPTANLAPDGEGLLPAGGVYAGFAFVDEEREARAAMMNLGWRPTVNGRDFRFEVQLIDWSGDLTNRSLTVQFRQRLRDETKFSSVEELKAQLERDREQARRILTGIGAERY